MMGSEVNQGETVGYAREGINICSLHLWPQSTSMSEDLMKELQKQVWGGVQVSRIFKGRLG